MSASKGMNEPHALAVRPKKHPSYPHFAKLEPRLPKYALPLSGKSSIRSPVTAAPAAVLCARPFDNVSHADVTRTILLSQLSCRAYAKDQPWVMFRFKVRVMV
jgi:hypothetical protein